MSQWQSRGKEENVRLARLSCTRSTRNSHSEGQSVASSRSLDSLAFQRERSARVHQPGRRGLLLRHVVYSHQSCYSYWRRDRDRKAALAKSRTRFLRSTRRNPHRSTHPKGHVSARNAVCLSLHRRTQSVQCHAECTFAPISCGPLPPDRRTLSFPADELARRLGMQIKDVTKIAHRLLEDQIVQV